jgi:hypothetical protein
MKNLMTLLLALPLSLLLNGCSQWDDLVDSITGSDDDEAVVTAPATETPVATTPQTEYSKHESFHYDHIANGDRMAWRIPQKGPDFGEKLKVVFSDGHTVYVADTSNNYREDDGFVFKPGIGPNGEGQDDIGTSHGGVFIHAPYGNRSTDLTIYY